MNNSQEAPAPKQILFNNNPFSLAFNAMSQAFKINQNPSITIIVGSIVIWLANQISGASDDLTNILAESTDSEGARVAILLLGVGISIVAMIATVFVSTVWAGFMAYVGTKNARLESTSVKQAFRTALSKFWTILGINLFIGLLVVACLLPAIIFAISGTLISFSNDTTGAVLMILAGLLGIPGLVFAIRLSFSRGLSLYTVFDENLGAFDAMKRSIALTKGRLMEVWGMSFPGAIIPIVGPLLTCCGLGAHYMQLKVYRDHDAPMPKVHILSWLPLIALVALFLFIALFMLLIGALVASA